MRSGIYQIRNQVNGHRYIGSAVNLKRRHQEHLRRLRRGNHCNLRLQAAFDKYGENTFVFSVLAKVKPKMLIECEQHHLDMLNPEYNIAPVAGSPLGRPCSPETRKKMSDGNKGKHHCSEETRRKLSQSHIGHQVNEETKRKISKALMGRLFSAETRRKISEAQSGERHHMYGKRHSPETRRKMSIAQRARWRRIRAARIVLDSSGSHLAD